MEEVAVYSETTRKRYDPTHTTGLRNAFARDMNRRFAELSKMVRKSVDTNDCFGLRKKDITTFQMTPAYPDQFAFPRSQAKIEEFMKWLRTQVDAGIITVGEYNQVGSALDSSWTNMYILDSYKRGVMRARYEMINGGMLIPTIEASGGIDAVMSTMIHMDRVGILYTRVFEQLKGVTEDMATKISQILSQGIIDGDNPVLLARKLVAAIDGSNAGALGITDSLGRFIPARRRAEMIARTETIRAFSEATLNEFRNWGILGVSVKAEFRTAMDDRVCPECGQHEKQVFTIEEASGMIPMHPNCRCAWIPYIPDILKYRS